MAPSARTNARHLHLVRAAHSAGEAFGYPAEAAQDRGALDRLNANLTVWLGISVLAALALYGALG